jgi:aspartyl-tRNA(Asn)/glutamyl-tRNA(Gln) amidotransferase subunit C
MISREEVRHIANLARIKLTPKEERKFQKELASILDYVEKLKKLDVSKIEPTTHAVWVENVLRKDQSFPADPKVREKMVEMAPDQEQGWIKTKAIL